MMSAPASMHEPVIASARDTMPPSAPKCCFAMSGYTAWMAAKTIIPMVSAAMRTTRPQLALNAAHPWRICPMTVGGISASTEGILASARPATASSAPVNSSPSVKGSPKAE